jgi:glucosamine--fructose-6-phosphate aminotransferase (isomerizing)
MIASGKAKGTFTLRFHMYLQELELIPEKVRKALETNDKAKEIAETLKMLLLVFRRGYNFQCS